jgi:hypothetical protein
VVELAWSRVPDRYAGGIVATVRPSLTGEIKGNRIFSPSIMGVGFGADSSSKTLLSRNFKEEVKSHQGVEEKEEK